MEFVLSFPSSEVRGSCSPISRCLVVVVLVGQLAFCDWPAGGLMDGALAVCTAVLVEG